MAGKPIPSDQPTRAKPMLGSIVCTPSTATVRSTVKVEVLCSDGTRYDNSESTPITINGVPGTRQYLSWKTPGAKSIVVLARRADGTSERLTTSVTIEPARDDAIAEPSLHVRWSLEHPGRATFHVVRPKETIPVRAIERLKRDSTPVKQERVGARRGTRKASVTETNPEAGPRGGLVAAGGGAGQPPYSWTIAGGRPISSTRSSITHDFTTQLDPNRPYTVFDVSVSIAETGWPPVSIQRTVAIWNPYYSMKQRSVLQPPVVTTDRRLRFAHRKWHAVLAVYNPESFDVVLTKRRIQLVGNSGTSKWLPVMSTNITLAANVSTSFELELANEDVDQDVAMVVAHFTGTSQRRHVRVHAVFDIPEHVTKTLRVPTQIAAHLTKLVSRGPLRARSTITTSDLHAHAQDPLVSVLRDWQDTAPPHVLDAHVTPPNAIEGDECDPTNLPDVVPDGLYCMPTEETQWVEMPARFMNAYKGDIVLSAGDGGLVAETLASVDPPQPFSHSGIMTRNLDEITHSTAAIDRMTDESSGYVDSDGFRPDILKYLWPGAITQTVKHAVDGESLVDPESGKTYEVGGFGSLQSKDTWTGVTTVSMVVKPDPLAETAAIRSQLGAIADFASSQAGKCHYRFFCYTDPTIDEVAPAEARWAAGTTPTVCSSLIWRAIQSSGAMMEGGLEAADMEAGAQSASNTPEGLYLYQADERLHAGEVLFAKLEHMALMAAGQLGAALSDFEETIGNQVLNAFASDWTDRDAGDSDKWRDTKDANAVSPQNLMFYDAPLYGYSEPLIYRDKRFEQVTIYRWKHVEKTGILTGTVWYNDEPVGGADVQLTSAQTTHSGSNGRFTLSEVPEGTAIVKAQKVIGELLMSGSKTVEVVGNETKNINIHLEAPSHLYRRLAINGAVTVRDYEFAAAGYPWNQTEFNAVVELSPSDATHATKNFDCVCDDDVLGRLTLTFDLQSDDSVEVKARIRCYDSNKADTDDYDEWTLDTFTIPAGKSWEGNVYVDGSNYAAAYFEIENQQSPS